jgi:hypothetical protein
VRLGWVVLSVVSAGTGVFAYLLAWLIIPDEEGKHSTAALVLVILLFLMAPLCGCCGLTGLLFSGEY